MKKNLAFVFMFLLLLAGGKKILADNNSGNSINNAPINFTNPSPQGLFNDYKGANTPNVSCSQTPSCNGNYEVYSTYRSPDGRNVYTCGLRRDWVAAASCAKGWGEPIWNNMELYTCVNPDALRECYDSERRPLFSGSQLQDCLSRNEAVLPDNLCPSPVYRNNSDIRNASSSAYACNVNSEPLVHDSRGNTNLCNQCGSLGDGGTLEGNMLLQSCIGGAVGSITPTPIPTPTTACGDGVIQPGEACEASVPSACATGQICTPSCHCITPTPTSPSLTPSGPAPICGDGIANQKGEECDEGSTNGAAGSTCSVSCQRIALPVEKKNMSTKTAPVCGNRLLESGELCDDGNINNSDGCASTCTVEKGYTCTGTPSNCVRAKK